MEIKLNTEKKEITVLETVKITDLLNEIATICPGVNPDEWSITGAYDNYFQPYYTDGTDIFDLNDLITEN